MVITSPQTNRDYYRIGFGIDFIDMYRAIKTGKEAQKEQQTTPPAGSGKPGTNPGSTSPH